MTSVNVSAVHDFSKAPALEVRLLEGLGVEGDAHCGTTVRHRYDRRRDPNRLNLRQVHLIATELIDELAQNGHALRPGDLGENVTTTGVDLIGLPLGTVLRLGDEAQIHLTGLRTPCRLIDGLQPGLMQRMWGRDEAGRRIRRAGVMAVVMSGGVVRAGDPLTVVLPAEPHTALGPV
ncbi:MAG TPA: MOSC domain-containing protein [Nocardioidaceae bacterium]|nr:MOSC domain-containing protein [Nocardioidaceae bacterium]